MYAFFFLYDKLRTYGAFAVRNRYVLPEYKNVKNVQIRIKFEFENFGSDKTVLWKTYVTYGENAKERKSTYRKRDRKSTRLNSSHSQISYAVFCLKKKKT